MENMNDTKEQGVALFIVQEDLKEKIYFEEYLPQRIKRNFKLSSEVLSLRNVLIIMAFIEVIASIWGFSYYFIRRVLIILNISVFNICICKHNSTSSFYLRYLCSNRRSGNMSNDLLFSICYLK